MAHDDRGQDDFGYSLIGRMGMAIKPAAKITIDSTAAKIGRSMKNLRSPWPALYCPAMAAAVGVDGLSIGISGGRPACLGKDFCRPTTTILSSGARPDCTTRNPPTIPPSTTSLRCAFALALSTA